MILKAQTSLLIDQLLVISTKIQTPLNAEHIEQLASQLLYYHQHHTLQKPPYFNEECTPNLSPIIAPLHQAFNHWLHNTKQGEELFKQVIKNLSINHLLLILGQRRTSASITNAQALPPQRTKLLTAFNQCHKHSLSVGARAWCKHVIRSKEEFWGKVKGNDEEKNRVAFDVLENILDNATWWNVFEHYKHHLVYEVRLPSGHGARWKLNEITFIGFLEPFINQ